MNRRVIAIGAGGAAVLLLLWYFLLWSPQGKNIEAARERRQTAEQQAQELNVRLDRLREQKRRETATRSQIELLRVAIPDQPNLAQFILDTNDAATRSGVDFLSVAPTPPAAPAAAASAGGTAPAPAEIRLALSITGGYFQVIDFVNRLNEMPRLVVIDTMNVGASGEATQLSVQLTARMFVSSVPAGAAPATGSAPASGAPTTTTTAPGGVTTTTAAGATATTTPGVPTTVAP